MGTKMVSRLISTSFLLGFVSTFSYAQKIEIIDFLGEAIKSAKVIAVPLNRSLPVGRTGQFDPNLERQAEPGLNLLKVTAQGWRRAEHVVFFNPGDKSLVTITLFPAEFATKIGGASEQKRTLVGQVHGYASLKLVRIRALDPRTPAILGDVEPAQDGKFSLTVPSLGPVMILLLYRGEVVDSRLAHMSDKELINFW